jgi:WD40 repeat protein
VWDSQTCVLGWPVQGIWTPDKGLSDINAVDKHHAGTLLATADDFGSVNIYRYPCVEEKSAFVSLSGHSSHVTCVRWTCANNLVSVGGNDKCTFIWTKVDK